MNEALPDDANWIKVHDDPGRGLLAVRDKLAEGGFVADPSSVYWYGLRMSADDVLGHDERALRRQDLTCVIEILADKGGKRVA